MGAEEHRSGSGIRGWWITQETNFSHHPPLTPEQGILPCRQPVAGALEWYSWARWKSIKLHHMHRQLLSSQHPMTSQYPLCPGNEPRVTQPPETQREQCSSHSERLFQDGVSSFAVGLGRKKWVGTNYWSPTDFRCFMRQMDHWLTKFLRKANPQTLHQRAPGIPGSGNQLPPKCSSKQNI